MKKTKVFILIKGLGLGGAENLLALSLPYIDRSRFDYEICYFLPHKNALRHKIEEAGIPVHCLNQSNPLGLRVVPKLVKLLRDRQADVLHMHLPYAGILGRAVSKLTPVKAVVYTEHNLFERYHRVTALLNRMTYTWNDAVVAVSKEVEHSIRTNAHINGRPKLDTILNGVDVASLSQVPIEASDVKKEFGIPSENSVIIHVGNFTPKKRHEDLLKAAQIVLREKKNVTFILVGTGPLEASVKEDAKAMGIDSNLVFTGLREDVPRLMAASDMFVLPSQFEGLPLSLLEAMCMGKPVVASRVGGIPEVIENGVDGFLVDPLNPVELSENIIRLLNNPDVGKAASVLARKRVMKDFSIKRMVGDLESLYAEVLLQKETA